MRSKSKESGYTDKAPSLSNRIVGYQSSLEQFVAGISIKLNSPQLRNGM